jgi:hypothetical protein
MLVTVAGSVRLSQLSREASKLRHSRETYGESIPTKWVQGSETTYEADRSSSPFFTPLENK